MRRPEIFVPLGAGLVLAALTDTVFSSRIATILTIVTAFMIGAAFQGRPFQVGALLMSPIAVGSLVMLLDNGLAFIFLALLANAAAVVLLGLVAAGGVLLGEVLRNEVAHRSITHFNDP